MVHLWPYLRRLGQRQKTRLIARIYYGRLCGARKRSRSDWRRLLNRHSNDWSLCGRTCERRVGFVKFGFLIASRRVDRVQLKIYLLSRLGDLKSKVGLTDTQARGLVQAYNTHRREVFEAFINHLKVKAETLKALRAFLER